MRSFFPLVSTTRPCRLKSAARHGQQGHTNADDGDGFGADSVSTLSVAAAVGLSIRGSLT